jgi:hypothetical protein
MDCRVFVRRFCCSAAAVSLFRLASPALPCAGLSTPALSARILALKHHNYITLWSNSFCKASNDHTQGNHDAGSHLTRQSSRKTNSIKKWSLTCLQPADRRVAAAGHVLRRRHITDASRPHQTHMGQNGDRHSGRRLNSECVSSRKSCASQAANRLAHLTNVSRQWPVHGL